MIGGPYASAAAHDETPSAFELHLVAHEVFANFTTVTGQFCAHRNLPEDAFRRRWNA
jgi:hypothetical protein